jgi:hypothetical protein
MKNYLLIFALIIFRVDGINAAQDLKQTIRGTVVDAVSGYPVIGAYVILLNSDPKIGTVTDSNGIFELKKVPVGRQALQINFIGYEPKTYSNLLVVSGKELVFEVKLEEKVNNIGEVVIKGTTKKSEAQNELAIVSA